MEAATRETLKISKNTVFLLKDSEKSTYICFPFSFGHQEAQSQIYDAIFHNCVSPYGLLICVLIPGLSFYSDFSFSSS